MKRKILRISPALFLNLFFKGDHPGYEVTDNAIPEDAKIVDCRFDGFNGGIVDILLESEKFEDVKDGVGYPYLFVEIKRK